MHVYVIEEKMEGQPTGFVKIGKAHKPTGRITGLRSGNPRELMIHSTVKCGKLAGKVEKLAHVRLSEHCVNGEWFEVSAERAKACVTDIVGELGKSNSASALFESPEDRVGYLERLQSLPEVFDLHQLESASGLSRQVLYLYINRWMNKGFVKPIGPRAGVYFNLVRDPNASERLPEALQLLLQIPRVLIGGSALSWHGWTSRPSSVLELAVPISPKQRTYPQVNGVALIGRTMTWWNSMGFHCRQREDEMHVLDPAYALVDALATKPLHRSKAFAWRPAPEDIKRPEGMTAKDFRSVVLEAASVLKADERQISNFIDSVGIVS